MPGCAKVPHVVRKPIEQKTPLAAWATLARDEAQMSVEEVVAALEARGHRITAPTIRGIEGGSKGASARLRKLLAEVYGTNPPGMTAPASDVTLATALQALADELRLLREGREADEAWRRSVDAELSHLARLVGGGPRERSVPQT